MIPTVCPAYLPNVKYCAWIVRQQKIYFSGSTTYQKQTFRNRTEIYGANGKEWSLPFPQIQSLDVDCDPVDA